MKIGIGRRIRVLL